MNVRIVHIPVVWKSALRKSTSPIRVASLLTIILPLCKAMKAMNMPMPTATPALSEKGMLLNNFSNRGDRKDKKDDAFYEYC